MSSLWREEGREREREGRRERERGGEESGNRVTQQYRHKQIQVESFRDPMSQSHNTP